MAGWPAIRRLFIEGCYLRLIAICLLLVVFVIIQRNTISVFIYLFTESLDARMCRRLAHCDTQGNSHYYRFSPN